MSDDSCGTNKCVITARGIVPVVSIYVNDNSLSAYLLCMYAGCLWSGKIGKPAGKVSCMYDVIDRGKVRTERGNSQDEASCNWTEILIYSLLQILFREQKDRVYFCSPKSYT